MNMLRKILAWVGVTAAVIISAQLIAAPQASAHTPSASISCLGWSLSGTNYEAQQNNTFGYSVDGGTEVDGTFTTAFTRSGLFPADSGNHTLTAFVYQNNDPQAKYSKTYHLWTSECVTVILIPAAPVPGPATCESAGTLTVPADTDTISWTQTGEGQVTATITAKDTTFPDGTTSHVYTEVLAPQLTGEQCELQSSTPPPPSSSSASSSPPVTITPATTASTTVAPRTSTASTSRVVPVIPSTSTPALALTGSSSQWGVIAALLLLAVGVVLLFGGSRRGHRRRRTDHRH